MPAEEKWLEQIVKYYLPIILESHPHDLLHQGIRAISTAEEARDWLDGKLKPVFDKAFVRLKSDVEQMQLIIRYKDVTYETLKQADFLNAVKKAFPRVEWERAYKRLVR